MRCEAAEIHDPASARVYGGGREVLRGDALAFGEAAREPSVRSIEWIR